MPVTRSQSRQGAIPSGRTIVTLNAPAQLLDAAHHARFSPRIKYEKVTNSRAPTGDDRESTQEPGILELTVSFATPPRSGSSEFVIGSSHDADIKYGSRGEGVSGHHLLLSFDEFGQVVIKDISRLGSRISYRDDHYNHVIFGDRQNPPRWIVPPNREVTIMFTQIPLSPRLTLHVPDHAAQREQYLGDIRKFQALQNNPVPFLGGLGLGSMSVTAGEPPDLDRLRLPSQKKGRYAWILGKRIGSGGFGEVKEVFNSMNWRKCAGKQMDKKEFALESSLLESLNHRHIARYIDQEIRQEDNPILVMEYCPLGDLLAQHRKQPFTRGQVIQVIAQATSALRYLHQNGVAHRDLKPQNILVRSRQPVDIAVSDFGLATKDRGLMSTQGTGTYVFMAPEVAAEFVRDKDGRKKVQTKYDNRADIWSMGLVALDLLLDRGLPSHRQFGIDLDRDGCDQQYAKQIVKIRDEWLAARQSDAFARLVGDMVQWNPAGRPSAAECAARAAALVPGQTTPPAAGAARGAAAAAAAGSPEGRQRQQAPGRPAKRKGTDGSSQETAKPLQKKPPTAPAGAPATAGRAPQSTGKKSTAVTAEPAGTLERQMGGSGPTSTFHDVRESSSAGPATVRLSQMSSASSSFMKKLGLATTKSSR